MSLGPSPGRPHHWSTSGGFQPGKSHCHSFGYPVSDQPSAATPASAAPSVMACEGQEVAREVSAGAPKGQAFPLRLHGPLAGRTGQVGKQNLHIQLLLQDRNCKAWLVATKSYPGRRFLSYEMHLLIVLQKPSSPLLLLPPLSFSVLPLTFLQAFRNVSTPGCQAVC